ncbi:hypothetical protein JXA32_05050, partial [Candidatus Sumerlaeota bacterium]|nr:hypothetical protein [Candidatus Sumerlaeota bacterium]
TASAASGIAAADIANWNAAHAWGDHSLAGYLTEESDPLFSASTASGIVTTDIDNWNSAFNWGDHSLAGYLTEESDPFFAASVASGIAATDIANWTAAYTWGDHSLAGYLTEESDPLFSASAASGIVATDIENWNSALTWGDHSLAGYLTEESDPLFAASTASEIAATDIAHWNAAHAWGDHSLIGYLLEESDPLFTTSPAAQVTTSQISNWDIAFSWGDHSLAGYLTEESDPLFAASAASGIAATDIVNWNTALGWGDHNEAGYLTEESDPLFAASAASGIAAANISDWDAAHGWGDHAAAGYLTSEADTLAKVTARGSTTRDQITLYSGARVYGSLIAGGSSGFGLRNDGGAIGLWVADSGYIGIGTNEPETNLHLYNSGNTTLNIEAAGACLPSMILKNDARAWAMGIDAYGNLRVKYNGGDRYISDIEGTLSPGSTTQDLGYSWSKWRALYVSNVVSNGPLDFSDVRTLDHMRSVKPAAKPRNAVYATKPEFESAGRYAKELDPMCLPKELTGYFQLLENYQQNTDPDWLRENVYGDSNVASADIDVPTEQLIEEHIANFKANNKHPDEVDPGAWGVVLNQGFSWNYKAICELADENTEQNERLAKLEYRMKSIASGNTLNPSARENGNIVEESAFDENGGLVLSTQNIFTGERYQLFVAQALEDLAEITGKDYTSVEKLSAGEVVDYAIWRKFEFNRLVDDAKRAMLEENPWIEISIEEAIEQVEEVVEEQSLQIVIKYRLDLETLQVVPYNTQETVGSPMKTGRVISRIKANARFDENTGKFYRKRTLEDVELSPEILEQIELKLELPEFVKTRLPQEDENG